jgi:hypothetical protein
MVDGTDGHRIMNNVLDGFDAGSGETHGLLFGYSTSEVHVDNNDIANWSTGVSLNRARDVQFHGNTIRDNSTGLEGDSGSLVTIENNDFTYNSQEALGFTNVGQDIRVQSNNFIGNGAGINVYSGTRIVDATGNWWGANSGPYNAATNPDGTGDGVSGSVSYEPWVQRSYSLTIGSTAGGNVTDPGEGTFGHDAGAVIHLLAVADPDYDFLDWTGDVLGVNDTSSPDTSVTMNGDYSITANFVKLGDADGDGDVDVVDWVKVKRIILGLDSKPPRGKPDADKDGDVDIFDWVKVKRTILGL